MSKLVAYCRVSSNGQQENTSLEYQMSKIKAYCELTGHTLAAEFHEVQSASGAKTRHFLREALELVLTGTADGIICMSLDRLARSTIEGLRIIAELERAGRQFVVLDLDLDTNTPIGRCVLTVLLSFAQLERDTIAERCRAGRKAIAEAGGYYAGRPPYGWNAVDGKLVINELELTVRRLILRWHASGMGGTAIARELNRHAIPAKNGGLWLPDVVRKILRRGTNYKLNHVMQQIEREGA